MNWISLDDEPVAVATPTHIVYSTNPKLASGSDGEEYFLKGPETETVVAEAVGYQLATIVGLDVPKWAFCHHPGDANRIYFASRAIRTRSGIDQLLQRADLIQNRTFMQDCVAFDIWISNRDRNIGNIVAEPAGGRDGSDVRLVAIDFEKADVLRGTSRFIITRDFTPRHCLPVNELAQHFRGLPRPDAMCTKIAAVTEDAIRSVFDEVAFGLSGHSVTWCESASNFLASRGQRIRDLVNEAWQ